MKPTEERTLIREGEEVDKHELPITATYDPQVERLLRQWEEERDGSGKRERAKRLMPRREPFAYD